MYIGIQPPLMVAYLFYSWFVFITTWLFIMHMIIDYISGCCENYLTTIMICIRYCESVITFMCSHICLTDICTFCYSQPEWPFWCRSHSFLGVQHVWTYHAIGSSTVQLTRPPRLHLRPPLHWGEDLATRQGGHHPLITPLWPYAHCHSNRMPCTEHPCWYQGWT